MFVTRLLCAGSAILAVATAAPATAQTTCKKYVDTYDNITTVPEAPELTPLSFYGGLDYIEGFTATPGVILLVGTTPASSPNVAAISINQDVLNPGSQTVNPFGVITTANTGTKYFSLSEFYYACVTSTNGEDVPVSCIIEVYGYDIYGSRVGSATFAYAPPNTVVSPMSRAILPLYYIYLRNVTFAVADALDTATTVIHLDNVTHTNCH